MAKTSAKKNTPLKIGVLMDPIESITPYKDTSFAMLLAAQRMGWEVYYLNAQDVFIHCGQTQFNVRRIDARDNTHDWFTLGEARIVPAQALDAILIRLDPPFNQEYMYICHALALAEQQGCWPVNAPQALCNHNEKIFISEFPQLCAPTLITRDVHKVKAFITEHKDVILKPLDGMGGASIFRVQEGDKNAPVIMETLSQNGQNSIVAQGYLPAIKDGDKRILIVNGTPVDYALARIPSDSDNRGNLAAGGKGVGQPLTERDRDIAETVGHVLKKRGILFAGIDVIGDCLTEINITSPTGVRELDKQFDLDIAGQLMNVLQARLDKR